MSRAYSDYLRSIAGIDASGFDDEDTKERMSYLEEMVKGASHYIDHMEAQAADLRMDKQNLTAQVNTLVKMFDPVIGLLRPAKVAEPKVLEFPPIKT